MYFNFLMMLPWRKQHFVPLLKIFRLFPSPNLGWPVEQSILTVALFDLPAAWELRWAPENGDQKSRFRPCLGLYLSIQDMYCNVKCATCV